MTILSIDTSFDETSVAITDGQKVLSNVIYSQILLHKKWGGVVPSIAKRAHEERIDFVINEAIKKIRNSKSLPCRQAGEIRNNGQNINYQNSSRPSQIRFSTSSNNNTHYSSSERSESRSFNNIDSIAVTQGPGLAVALEVGIKKARELAQKYNKKLIAVNHMEGHIYSCFVQNSRGNPKRDFNFPYLVLLVSGGHTELVIFKNHLEYQIIGKTTDDAAGEALDKGAKLLGLGYPGGPVIERIAENVSNQNFYNFPRPLSKDKSLNFSFSGLKTSFYYFIKKMEEESKIQHLQELISSYQEAVFDSLIIKTERAIKETGINNLAVAGGVIANQLLRKKLRELVKKYKGSVIFPPFKYLTGDNAAMIGVAAYYKAQKGIFVEDVSSLDRIPRLSL